MSVVVPTRNRCRLLDGLIQGILGQDLPLGRLELIVVDDASTDDTPSVLARWAARDHRVRPKRLDRHGGPAVARNVGWRAATASTIAFTDDDCLPDQSWLRSLLMVHATGAEVVQGATVPDITEHGARGTFSHWIEITEPSYLFETCNISYQTEVLEELGGFDEAFGVSRGGAPNGEDADLGWRALKAGAPYAFATGAVVVHPVSTSSFTERFRGRLRSFRMPYFIRRHPEFRKHLYHRIFFQRSHPPALLALGGCLIAVTCPSWWASAVCVASTIPYAYFRIRINRLPGRLRRWPVIIAGAWLIDAADALVLLGGSVRWRRLML